MSHAGLLNSHIGHCSLDSDVVNRTDRAVLLGAIPQTLAARPSCDKVNEEGTGEPNAASATINSQIDREA